MNPRIREFEAAFGLSSAEFIHLRFTRGDLSGYTYRGESLAVSPLALEWWLLLEEAYMKAIFAADKPVKVSSDVCPWCKTDLVASSKVYEGPHATWCPRYRRPTFSR